MTHNEEVKPQPIPTPHPPKVGASKEAHKLAEKHGMDPYTVQKMIDAGLVKP